MQKEVGLDHSNDDNIILEDIVWKIITIFHVGTSICNYKQNCDDYPFTSVHSHIIYSTCNYFSYTGIYEQTIAIDLLSPNIPGNM